jgi:hypothetical protein
VVAFAHDYVQVRLASALCVANSLLENFFCFFDKLPVQVDSITCNLPDGIVLAEDIFRGLLVVLVGLRSVFLALFT